MNGRGNGEFRVIGLDLAADAKDTAYCEIVVNPASGTARVGRPKSGTADASDESLLRAFSQPHVARIGVDAPFGWPISFVGAVSIHSHSNRWPDDDPNVYAGSAKDSEDRYRDLKYRSTDLYVWKHVRKPQSVVTRSLSSVGIRNAGLLARAQSRRKLKADRSGMTGHFVEVYPAAAYARWSIKTDRDGTRPQSYKKNPAVCRQVATDLFGLLPLDWQVEQEFPKGDHNAVDALAAALVALMVTIDPKRDQGFIEPVPAGMEAVAKREGWIALPQTCSLTRLRDWLSKRSRPARTAR